MISLNLTCWGRGCGAGRPRPWVLLRVSPLHAHPVQHVRCTWDSPQQVAFILGDASESRMPAMATA